MSRPRRSCYGARSAPTRARLGDGTIDAAPGIIFDFDGVIALSEPIHGRAWAELALHCGRELPEGFADRGIGSTDAEMCADLETVWPGAGSAEDLLRIKRGRYRRLAVERCELTPGVAEAIERLARRSPLAVATSSSLGDIEPILQRYELRGFFTAILTIESVERPKPDPQIYHMAAERLNREPSRCWVFEDSPRGMEAARRSGARAIAVTTTFGSDALAPHCASIADFLDADRIETLLF